MRPDVRVFSRDAPCTKAEIWECLVQGPGKYSQVQVDVAHSIIGKNVPRVMESNSYLRVVHTATGDYYQLTDTGELWLLHGILSYVKNHPESVKTLKFLPGAAGPSRRVVRKR